MIPENLFSRLRASHEAATGNAGLNAATLSIAGHPARMVFAGRDLLDALMHSLQGMVIDPDREFEAPSAEIAPIVVRVWSGATSAFPCPELQVSLAQHPGKVTVINAGSVHLQYNPDGEILSCIDTESGQAFYYAGDPARLPDYEVCTPMRMLINWHCARSGALMVHAASVGMQGRGALIIGRSGAGKSTTGLQCLLHGMDYLGDDYVALSGGIGAGSAGPVTVHHLYRGCKVMDDALARLPMLKPHVIMRGGASGKNVVIASSALGTLTPQLELVAIVRPRVAYASTSTFSPLSPIQAVTEFAGSTILQMPGTGTYMLKALTSLCARIPAFEMALGREPAEISAALRGFILQRAGL